MTDVVDIPVSVQGMIVSFPRDYLPMLNSTFTARKKESKRIWGGPNNGAYETLFLDKPIYQVWGDKCFVGSGAIKFLSLYNPFIKFKFTTVVPERTKVLDEFVIPEKLKQHPNFNLPDGTPRTYFYESLEECRKQPLGSIELPTQSGKTSILLTLAHNLKRQLGSGAIFVTSDALRKQLLNRAVEYGIDNVVTYDEFTKGKANRTKIDLTQNWIVVLTPRLLNSRVKSSTFDCSPYKWVIYDECHHVSSPEGQKIFYAMQNVVRAYGFSATPIKGTIPKGALNFNKIDYEDALRISSFGLPIYRRTMSDNIREGNSNETILINYEYNWSLELQSTLDLQFKQLHNKEVNYCDYSDMLQLLKLNKERMKLISDIQSVMNEDGRNTALSISRRSYGLDMLDNLKRSDTCAWYGSNSVYINDLLMIKLKDFDAELHDPREETTFEEYEHVYKSSKLTSDTIYQYYGNQIKNLITTSGVGSEGISFDKPINTVILAEGKGANRILITQRAGRSASITNKKASIVINILDKNAPTILRKHSVARMTTLKEVYGVKTPYVVRSLQELQNLCTKINGDNYEVK